MNAIAIAKATDGSLNERVNDTAERVATALTGRFANADGPFTIETRYPGGAWLTSMTVRDVAYAAERVGGVAPFSDVRVRVAGQIVLTVG